MSTAVQPPASERPVWLKPRRDAPPPALEPALPPDFWLTRYANRVWWWWNKRFGWGVAVSTGVHLLLVLILSLIVFHGNLRSEWGVAGAFSDGNGDTDLDLPLDSHLAAELSSAAPLEFTSVAPTDGLENLFQGASNRLMGAIGGTKDGNGDGAGGGGGDKIGMNVRPPSSAVTKGSFTVWTDPEDPNPGQNYEIVIQVKLPKSVTLYKLRDLEGTVRGTDRYFKAIQYPATERRAVKDGAVQLRVSIPGAAVLVRDTIKVKSALLNEEQTIEIVF